MTGFARRTPGTRPLYAKARRASFDGNRSDDVRHWLFAEDTFRALVGDTLDELMDMTAGDNLRWVVFPPEGFRL